MLKVIAFGLISSLWLIGSTRTQYERHRSGVTATATPFFSTSTRHQVAPWNVGQGAANSLSAMPSSSGVRIETPQKPEPASDFLPPELRDQHENAGTYSITASDGTTRHKVETLSMPETIAIRYVSNGGSDADDGLSWGTAKHTIYGALVSLPGGDGVNMSGHGTLYVTNGSAANPTSGAGIWLMGERDPNYANPPAGWLKCPGNPAYCTVNIIGVASSNNGPNDHKGRVLITAGSGSDTKHPAVWLSGQWGPVYLANLAFQYPGRAFVLGECSNHDRSGTCYTGATLENDTGNINHLPGNGPCMDITGSSYWIWLRDFGCSGNAINATGGRLADNAAAILIDGSGNNGNGLISISDTNLSNGGIKYKPGFGTPGILYITNVIEEGDFVHDMPPVVWLTAGLPTQAILSGINLADPGSSKTSIQNDEGGQGVVVMDGGNVVGPAVILSQYTNDFVASTVSPLVQGQVGFFNNYVKGETDVARRVAGLTPARFKNNANNDPSTWRLSNVGLTTVTTGQADPYGGTGATTLAATTSVVQSAQLGNCVDYTPVTGDWLVAGVWVQGMSPTQDSFTIGCWGVAAPAYSARHVNSGMQIGGPKDWQFRWIAEKVTSNAASQLAALALYNNTGTPTLYGPVLFVIPDGTLSDNEVLEFASSMNSADPSCQVGQICNVAGHPLVVSSYGTLSNCSSVTSPAKCDSAPAGSFVLDVGSTVTKVNTRAVTANSQILIIEDSSLGTRLGVSCNKAVGRTYMITDRTPGLSFTVSSSFAPTDYPACLSFQLLN